MGAVEFVRTPEERFTDLPGFPFEPRYVDAARRVAHALRRGGPAGAETVLLLHGQPTWSYLYRSGGGRTGRAWPARRGTRPDRVRALRQARGAARRTPWGRTWTGWQVLATWLASTA